MSRPHNEFPSPAETTRVLGETPPTTPHCEQRSIESSTSGGSSEDSSGGRGRVYRQATEFAADPQAVLLSTSCWCGAEKSEGSAFCVKCLGLLPTGIRFGLASLDPGEGLEEAFELAIGHLDRFGGESGCEVF